jgi:4-amino-4-deoxy-L-arabinose transferase-like glycosyltransferase
MPPPPPPSLRPRRRLVPLAAALLVVAVAGVLLFHRLGAGSLGGDEAIHAQVARNAATSGRWLPLRLYGGLYLSKPPLKLLAEAAVFRLWGVSTFTGRVLDAAAGVATLLAIFVLGRRFLPIWAAILAALLPLTAREWVFNHNVRDGTQDAALGLLLTLSLLLYFGYVEDGRRRRARLAASTLMAGLAMLVKGPVGLLLLPVLLGYELSLRWLRHEETPARPADALRHTALAVVPPLAYFAYLAVVAGRGLLEHLHHEVLLRATEGVDPGHLQGPFFYARLLGGDFGWWLLLLLPVLVVALGRSRRVLRDGGEGAARARRRAFVFAAWWAGVLLVAFSLPVSKLPWYVFPAYPALALLIAGGAAEVARRLPRPLSWAGAGALALALAAGLAVTWEITERPVPLAPAHRLAQAIEATGGRLLVKRGTRFQGEAHFYLHSLGETVWSIPPSFWRADGTCRFILREKPWPEPVLGRGPRSLRVAETWTRGRLWLIDLDRCLPPGVLAEER